jgi:hypothetical protein
MHNKKQQMCADVITYDYDQRRHLGTSLMLIII